MIACLCGKEISSKSEACPNCGHPTAELVAAYKGAPIEANKGENFTIPDLGLEMIWVEPGTFMMGDKGEQHQVTLTKGFHLGKHEVTQAQWEKVMGSNPSRFKGADRPVEAVRWIEAVSFCNKLTEMEKKAGRVPEGMAYQLPTEAQWEYACRAGTTTAYSWGDAITKTNANYRDSGFKQTRDVGQYAANPWGFHDMHGNVYEWCADWHGDYPSGAVRDPVGPADGSYRVNRGGSWSSTANNARCAYRRGFEPANSSSSLGFRLSLRPARK
jgi:formylglycine-generating enzyme